MRQNDRCRHIRDLVTRIPAGTVVTYGDIANQVYGTRTKARGVASVIKKETQRNRTDFPWWRVVDRKLMPTQAEPEARERLEAEDVVFTENGAVTQI